MSDDIDRVAGLIERATTKTYSQQPRFEGGTSGDFWGSWWPFLRQWFSDAEPPAYVADSRKRDEWLRKAWREEPHLAGVVNSVVTIDSNRGWTMVGGRNQVRKYTDMMHNAENGAGWRTFCRKASLGFWTTDLGALTELGREGRGGPLRAIYNLDSARCKLTGKPDYPLEYHPIAGGVQLWAPDDYFRCCSLPSDDESYYGLGFCAVSRAIEIVRLLYAVMTHDQELVAARAPKGLLLLQGISQNQWDDSLAAREVALNSMERRYYAGVQVLATQGMDTIDAKLVALSQLPANFNAKEFTDLCLYTYALCFGYDPSEFWPVQFGALGRGTESQVQQTKASGKGALDFAAAFQEHLSDELPETLHFEFESRDDQGEILATTVQQAKANLVRSIYESGLLQGAPLISQDEARQLLAEAGLIPEEWTQADEDVTATDTEDVDTESVAQAERRRDQAFLDSARVQRAIQCYPHEQIVRQSWPSDKLRVIWDPRRRRQWAAAKPRRRVERAVLWESKDGDVVITEDDVLRAIREGRERVGDEFANLLTAPEYKGEP